jgi:hypothetical protein
MAFCLLLYGNIQSRILYGNLTRKAEHHSYGADTPVSQQYVSQLSNRSSNFFRAESNVAVMKVCTSTPPLARPATTEHRKHCRQPTMDNHLLFLSHKARQQTALHCIGGLHSRRVNRAICKAIF